MTLRFRQCINGFGTQIVQHMIVQLLFGFGRRKLLGNGYAFAVRHKLLYILTESTLHNGFEFIFQLPDISIAVYIVFAEGFQVAKHALIDKTHQTIQLIQPILKWSSRKQYLFVIFNGILNFRSYAFGVFMHIAQVVRFIEHHQIPRGELNQFSLFGSKLIRTYFDGFTIVERILIVRFITRIERFSFEDFGFQIKLIRQLVDPLFTKRGWTNNQNSPFVFGPLLT